MLRVQHVGYSDKYKYIPVPHIAILSIYCTMVFAQRPDHITLDFMERIMGTELRIHINIFINIKPMQYDPVKNGFKFAYMGSSSMNDIRRCKLGRSVEKS